MIVARFIKRMGTHLTPAVLALAALALAPSAQAEPVMVDSALPDYTTVNGVSGNLSSIGSDTLNNLMTLWQEGFSKKYPNVKIAVEGKGSATAPPALIEGTAQLGPMSREMKSDEIEKFEAKYGFKPTKIGVALDSLAIFVNKDNPLEGLSLAQADAIFSSTHKRGAADIATWGQLGLGGDWAPAPISLYGRNSASGTYGFFKEHTLSKGDFKNTVKEQPGSSSVVQGITDDKFSIGYSGIGVSTSGVRALPLSEKDGEPFVEPTYEHVLAGKYPLSRMLYIYVVKAPNQPLDPVVKEFLAYVLSKEGQEIVVKDNYMPLPAKIAEKNLEMLK